MLGDSYATVDALEARLGREDDGTFEAVLDAASRAVEQYTKRQFNSTDTATPRLFRAVDYRRLPVDDFHTTDDLAIEIDGQSVAIANVDLRPWNGIVKGQPGWPYSDLLRAYGNWPWSRRAQVEVTAQWGWSAVPAAITQTTLNVAAATVQGGPSGSEGGPVRSESIDGYSVSYARENGEMGTALVALSTFSLATPYIRKQFGIA